MSTGNETITHILKSASIDELNVLITRIQDVIDSKNKTINVGQPFRVDHNGGVYAVMQVVGGQYKIMTICDCPTGDAGNRWSDTAVGMKKDFEAVLQSVARIMGISTDCIVPMKATYKDK